MKNNYINYIERKNNELNILNSFLKKRIKYNNPKNVNEVLNYKEKIVNKIKEENRKKFYHHITNNTQRKFVDGNFSYNYTYERFNGNIQVENFSNDFFNLSAKYKTKTFFTNCGMSAIVSLLSAMCLYNNIEIELLYEETYFETIKFLSSVNKNSKKKALYIDSIASDFSFGFDLIDFKKFSYVIIDTTCFLGNNYTKYIKHILALGIPCVLVRSVTKIDMMGTEYSHMGFVSFIYSDKNLDEELNGLIENCRHLIGVYGACLIPENFPSFIYNDKFIQLNNNRIELVNYNNTILFNYLEKNNYNVTIPNHKQFVLLYLKDNNLKLDELKQLIIEFCKRNRNIGVYHAVSFGFDYIAIDCYKNFFDGMFKIRICMNDAPLEIVKEFNFRFMNFVKTKLGE